MAKEASKFGQIITKEYINGVAHKTATGNSIIKFGDIRAPGGAVVVVSGGDTLGGLRAMSLEFLRTHFSRDGVPLTPQIESFLYYLADIEAHKRMDTYREQGVPKVTSSLFTLSKKSAVEKYCKAITLTQKDLADTISNCDQLGYVHSRFHHQYVPNELKPTDEEHEAFANNGVGLTSREFLYHFLSS